MAISLVPFSGTSDGAAGDGEVPEAEVRDGARVLEPAASYGMAGEYRQVPPGLYTVAIRPVDAAPDSAPILTGTFEAMADKAYTLAALGSKDSPRIQALADDLRPPEEGSARVRLLPAAPSAPEVSVVAQDGPTVAEGALFGRPTGYAEVPDGPWTLDVTVTSGDDSSVAATGKVVLASAGVYTVLLLEDENGDLVLKPLVDAQGMGTMPAEGVQTGGGGTAPRSTDPVVAGGLWVAGVGALVLLGLGARRRPRVVPARAR